jgi:hypothetical protein
VTGQSFDIQDVEGIDTYKASVNTKAREINVKTSPIERKPVKEKLQHVCIRAREDLCETVCRFHCTLSIPLVLTQRGGGESDVCSQVYFAGYFFDSNVVAGDHLNLDPIN